MDAGADPSNTQRIGEVVAERYRITAALGRGGMGSVYRAEHVHIKRPVALKLLHRELSRMPEINARFEREAFATGRVDHPNCVAITDSGTLDDGTTYLVMELLDGESLGDVLDDLTRLEPRRALHITCHVLRGLAHAHKAGVVHRDLKPENIFLVEQGGDPDFAKILDFGVAKLVGEALDAAGGQKLTAAGLTVGSPRYMSPEQASGDDLDGRSDIYSLSVVLYEMLAGQRPFDAENKMDVVRKHLVESPPPLSQVAPAAGIPPEIEAIVLRGLEKKPADRFPDARAYLAAVEGAIEALDRPAPPQPVPPGPATRPTEAARPAVTPQPPPMPTPTPTPQPMPMATPTPRPAPMPTEMMTAPAHQATPGPRSPARRVWPWLAAAVTIVAVIAAFASEGGPGDGEGERGANRKPEVAAGAGGGGKARPDRAARKAKRERDSEPRKEKEPEPEPARPPEPEPEPAEEPEPEAERANPFAGIGDDPEIAEAKNLLERRRWGAAKSKLLRLRKKRPKDARVAYELGHVYFLKNWWKDGFEQYRAAIDLDPRYREHPTIITDAIQNLESRKQSWRGRNFLVKKIGKPAIPHLEATLERWNNPTHVRRVKRVLKQID